MFGLVAARPVPARELLRDAPRSLRTLSNEHPDGWGVALRGPDAAVDHTAPSFGGAAGGRRAPAVDWMIHRSTECAARCTQFDGLVDQVATRLLVAHIRQKTVGEAKLANTHPFRRGDFVFAHNGTVRDVAVLQLGARTSGERMAEVTGDTDSERLFAFILTRIDAAGGDVARGVVDAVRELHAVTALGSATFLLSCGERMYAHRFGRTLFTVVRHAAANELRRTAAVVVASEKLTDEAWQEVPERALVAIDLAHAEIVQPLAA